MNVMTRMDYILHCFLNMILAEDWIWLRVSMKYSMSYLIIIHSYKEWQTITIK